MDRLRSFARSTYAPGIAMAAGAVIALVWASVAPDSYDSVWVGARPATEQFLIAPFFFLVGIEVRREMVAGELATWRRASAPVIAAVAGMAVPALIYVAIVRHGPGLRGWGIPMATDVAFAVGVIAMVRSQTSRHRVFLLTLGVADDALAIAVLVIFYRGSASAGPVVAFVFGLLLPGWRRLGRAGEAPPTAGSRALPSTIEHALLPFVNLIVLPVFALANAGVHVQPSSLFAATSLTVFVAVIVARVVGKPLAIVAAARALHGDEGKSFVPVGVAAAIGFTVPLLIIDAAFTGPLADAARAGLLVATALGAALTFVAARTT